MEGPTPARMDVLWAIEQELKRERIMNVEHTTSNVEPEAMLMVDRNFITKARNDENTK